MESNPGSPTRMQHHKAREKRREHEHWEMGYCRKRSSSIQETTRPKVIDNKLSTRCKCAALGNSLETVRCEISYWYVFHAVDCTSTHLIICLQIWSGGSDYDPIRLRQTKQLDGHLGSNDKPSRTACQSRSPSCSWRFQLKIAQVSNQLSLYRASSKLPAPWESCCVADGHCGWPLAGLENHFDFFHNSRPRRLMQQ